MSHLNSQVSVNCGMNQMEAGESILDALNEGDIFEADDDVEMLDVEEGELVEQCTRDGLDQCNVVDSKATKREFLSKNQRRKVNKKKNKQKRNALSPCPNVTDINRFVLDMCRRLREKKSYMVYTAVGCLGVSALYDLVKEVDAIQACGGQMTADGRRHRNGGGILWGIIKAREPKVYKEIMNKAKEFEKQFKRPNMRQTVEQVKDLSSLNNGDVAAKKEKSNVSDDSQVPSVVEDQIGKSNNKEKRGPVRDRLRVPVSYDDDLLGGDPKDDEA